MRKVRGEKGGKGKLKEGLEIAGELIVGEPGASLQEFVKRGPNKNIRTSTPPAA